MAAEIRNLREAMALLLAKINESAGENGTMSTDDIIRASFIRRMLKKFPLRNCDNFCANSPIDDATLAFEAWRMEMSAPGDKKGLVEWLLSPVDEGARVWCRNDPTRYCVDCELCPDEEKGGGE